MIHAIRKIWQLVEEEGERKRERERERETERERERDRQLREGGRKVGEGG